MICVYIQGKENVSDLVPVQMWIFAFAFIYKIPNKVYLDLEDTLGVLFV